MSVSAANGKKMLFSLRFPPDKILGVFEGSFTATQTGSPGSPFRTNSAFNHNLGAQAFLQMRYSFDGGTTWQDQHVTVPDTSTPGTIVIETVQIGVYCTTTQIVMVASNFTGTPRTVTYEVVAFAVGDTSYPDLTTTPVSSSGKLLSTRFNIQKTYLEGSVVVSVASGATPVEYDIVTHGLGYIPTVRLFYVAASGQLWPISPQQYQSTGGGSGTALNVYGSAVLTSNVLKARLSSGAVGSTDVTFYYKVYLDE